LQEEFSTGMVENFFVTRLKHYYRRGFLLCWYSVFRQPATEVD
jgi:hypothetical protein